MRARPVGLSLLLLLAVGLLALPAAAHAALFSTIAGNGTPGGAGDGGPGVAAQLNQPAGLARLPDGSLLIADAQEHRIRRLQDNVLTTWAGTGTPGDSGDGGPRLEAAFIAPWGLAVRADGGVYVSDAGANRVRLIGPDGTVSAVAGDGTAGYLDGVPPTQGRLDGPRGLALRPDGALLVADTNNHRIREVPAAGSITTVAGTNASGYAGDGGPAIIAQLNAPEGVVTIPSTTDFAFTDMSNNVVRRVGGATITTIAGTGLPGFNGDGNALAAQLNAPRGLSVGSTGGIVVADAGNHLIRRIELDGTISTLFGGPGQSGFAGDGGDGSGVLLAAPGAVLAESDSSIVIADTSNFRVRRYSPSAQGGTPSPGPAPAAGPDTGRTVGVVPVSGTVRIRRADGSFTTLRAGELVPDGSEVDTREGTLRLRVEDRGAIREALVSGGRAVVDQRADGLTDLRLSGPLRSCSSARASTPPRASSSAAAKDPPARSRKVRVRDRGGRFRTTGRYASAIVRGTDWTTLDDCRSRPARTVVTVREGSVRVTDLASRRTSVVRAGGRSVVAARPR